LFDAPSVFSATGNGKKKTQQHQIADALMLILLALGRMLA
jgi:hypothetical protein